MREGVAPACLDVGKYPAMTYKLKSVLKTGDHNTPIGDLTFHGATKDVTLVGNLIGFPQDPAGNIRAGFSLKGRVTARVKQAGRDGDGGGIQ